jgi:hypothetical protein
MRLKVKYLKTQFLVVALLLMAPAFAMHIALASVLSVIATHEYKLESGG